MNLLNDLIPENLLYAMGWTLVHSIWQLIIIGTAFWLGLKIFRKNSPAFKYNLGLGLMAFSLLLTSATFFYELSLFNPKEISEIWMAMTVDAANSTSFSISNSGNFLDEVILWIDLQLPLLVNIWFLGAVLFLFRLFNSLTELRILRKSANSPENESLQNAFSYWVNKLHISRKVKLKITPNGHSPVTFGFFKPIVLIPLGLIFHLSPTQLEAIIAHELAHVKRYDYLVNLGQCCMEILFFYHPSFWWMSQTIKELRENAADDLAVQSGISPSELAYSLAEVLNFAKQNTPELALAAGKRRNPTLQRIKRILGYPAQTYPQNPIISIPMLLTLILSAGLMASAQQDSPNEMAEIQPDVLIENPIINGLNPMHDTSGAKPDWEENDTAKNDITHAFHYRVSGDTLIYNKDTLIMRGDTVIRNGKGHYIFKNVPDMNWESMPEMAWDFPEPPVAPEMPEMPMAFFEMSPMPPMAEMPPMPEFGEFMFFDKENGGAKYYMNNKAPFFIHSDTSKMTKAEKEKWVKEWEAKANEWAKRSEEAMKEWEPKLKEWEAKMEAWQKSNEPKMKEFEAKMEEWQKANQPKMEEFQRKMEEWQKAYQPKMEEFQRKMEIWQKENAEKMEEFQRKLMEQFKKEDNSNKNQNSNNSN